MTLDESLEEQDSGHEDGSTLLQNGRMKPSVEMNTDAKQIIPNGISMATASNEDAN